MSQHVTHLRDDQLMDCYVAAHGGEAPDPRLIEHLSDCDRCRADYESLLGFLADVRDTADAEIDARFPADRLAVQQHAILQRIAQVTRPARVISFPGSDSAGGSRLNLRLTPRWTAAVAAACLIIGIALGAFMRPAAPRTESVRLTVPASTSVPGPARLAPSALVPVATAEVVVPDDDEFFRQLELALSRPSSRELQPFDALTPHVREIDLRDGYNR